MNTKKYNSEFYSLPKDKTYEVFQDYIKTNLDLYLKKIDEYDGSLSTIIKANKTKIEALCSAIIKAIDVYLLGSPYKSYSILSPALNDLKDFFLIPKPDKRILLSSKNLKSFFRIRESYQKIVSPQEMLHIPFECRHKIPTNRYSIPGVPCMYMSNTLHLCWEELGRMKIKYLYCTRIEFDINSLNLVNLEYTPAKIAFLNQPYKSIKGESDFFFKESLVTWPISFVSSIKTKYPKASFKIEYIIPQLIMQWCKESPFLEGISYFSTKGYPQLVNDIPLNHINIALPAKTNQSSGLCPELVKKLRSTDPFRIKNLMYCKKKQLNNSEKLKWLEKNPDGFINYIHRAVKTENKNPTIFDWVEMELCKSEAEKF
ncbi:MAG: hypothetical protein JXA77_17945 [Bacteroidales bacterium]|nr:hypothetical protein [Bacteroidales bacterium]